MIKVKRKSPVIVRDVIRFRVVGLVSFIAVFIFRDSASQRWIQSVTPRGRGIAVVSHSEVLCRTHPLPRGGTDRIQASLEERKTQSRIESLQLVQRVEAKQEITRRSITVCVTHKELRLHFSPTILFGI